MIMYFMIMIENLVVFIFMILVLHVIGIAKVVGGILFQYMILHEF